MLKAAENNIVDEIMASPNAPTIVKQVFNKLEEEQKRRVDFYNEISEYEKAEFINGEIIIHSPVKKEHNDVTTALGTILKLYVESRDLGYLGIEKIMIQLTRNDYEPDICFFGNKKSKKFKEGQSLFPPPDLIIEVLSKKTAKNDKGIKFKDYESHEVLEYWIINPVEKVVEQYRLNKQKKYTLILKSGSGNIESKAIKDFKIEIEAIFDKQKRMEELRNILK